MKPYYQDNWVTIYHGDCRELLSKIGPVDLVLTDPPYGVGIKAFDDDFSVVAALDTVEAGLLVSFMSPRRVPALVEALPTWKFERLLWMHKQADMAAPWRGWCMNSEAIVLFSTPTAHWPKPQSYRSDVYGVGPWERTGHPNGKPLAVVQDLLQRLSEPNAMVLDPFMGSGTTLAAAKNSGRKAIGVEIEEKYCELAAERMRTGTRDVQRMVARRKRGLVRTPLFEDD